MRNLQTYMIMFVVMFSTTIFANDIYMEQVGSTSDITITQEGVDNRIGTALNPSYFGGSSNISTIEQIGSRNELDLTVNGDNTNVTLSTTGNDNVQTITCGQKTAVTCNGTTINQTIAGDNNTTTTTIGAGTNSKMNISGSSNSVTHTSTSSGVVASDLTVTGSSNVVNLTQEGTLDKSIKIIVLLPSSSTVIEKSVPRTATVAVGVCNPTF